MPTARLARAIAQQRAHQFHGVRVAARAGVVLRVGDDHRPGGVDARVQGRAHRLVGAQEVDAPARLVGDQRAREGLDAPLDRVGVDAVAPQHRPAFGKVGGREAGREGQRQQPFVVVLEPREFLVERAGRIEARAHRVDGNQEGQAARHANRLRGRGGQALQQVQRAFAGLGHVDVWVAAVGDQQVGVAQHARRHVGVQVERGDVPARPRPARAGSSPAVRPRRRRHARPPSRRAGPGRSPRNRRRAPRLGSRRRCARRPRA